MQATGYKRKFLVVDGYIPGNLGFQEELWLLNMHVQSSCARLHGEAKSHHNRYLLLRASRLHVEAKSHHNVPTLGAYCHDL